ncbi:hypothetical protein [Pseudomonas sp. Y24-6]|uniref:hypothetical protein n=1 Tax=Pseudomonas sp. Y24-6 TaxID=2750013 RepID=UPI001CE15FDA|nr:hypothetical protein [Pseudomonas sp. Y24-6]MCA4965598.1 hypothetical protein [Pseudomonas sp. Y24-6]
MINLWQAHLSFAMIIFLMLPGFGLGRLWRGLLLLALLAASFIPLDGLTVAAYLRSHIDDLAITTMILMAWACLRRLEILAPAPRVYVGVLVIFAAMAVLLYPATLGWTYVDPYRLGFSPRVLLTLIALLTLGLYYLRNGLAVAMLAGATLAFMVGLKPSHNYWDYLVDPLLGLYCCVALLVLGTRQAYRWFLSRRGSASYRSI